MTAMLGGFITNIILDFFIGMVLWSGRLHICINADEFGSLCKSIFKVGLAPFTFAVRLAFTGCIIMYLSRGYIGTLFGSSDVGNTEIAKIMPIFLASVPFVAITRIATAGFYATEKAVLSYILTFIEPVLMLVLMLILPPHFGGQVIIWWSTVLRELFQLCWRYC